MYAHVNVWRLTDRGAQWKDDAGRAVGAALQAQPGFRAYTLVRTGEWEVVVTTVFASRPELEAALAAVAPLVRERVAPLAEDVLERREGMVLVHLTAAAGARHAA
jgi:heme-degrading monooxygenase HmoA